MRNATSFEGIAVPVSALAGVPLFEGLGPAELATVAASMRFREFAADEVIVREGQPGESMLVILEGLANELASMADSPAARSRSSSRRGAWSASCAAATSIGAMSLITGEPHSATVRRRSPRPPSSSAGTSFAS